MQPHLAEQRGDQLGAGHAALAAAAVHPHFQRQDEAFGQGDGLCLSRVHGLALRFHQALHTI